MHPMEQHGRAADGERPAWNGQVVTADVLPQLLNGQAELVVAEKAVVTPLAADELKRRGIRLIRRKAEAVPSTSSLWTIVQEREASRVSAAIKALDRDGIRISEGARLPQAGIGHWARAVAQDLAGKKRGGVIAFSDNAGLFCCIANKVAGIRAMPVAAGLQAARALKALGANLLAVETGTLTFFEILRLLKTIVASGPPSCPLELATTLQELDGHAHR